MKNLKLYEEYEEEGFKIFCDMDGVLTDFDENFRNVNKGKLTSGEYAKKNGRTSIWGPIDTGGLEWWSKMPWMPDGKELWEFLKQFDPIILSAPSRHKNSWNGKMIWARRELGIDQHRPTTKATDWDDDSKIILSQHKYKFTSGKNDILIDDTPKRVDNWKGAGGTAILHTSTKDTIQQLKEIMKIG